MGLIEDPHGIHGGDKVNQTRKLFKDDEKNLLLQGLERGERFIYVVTLNFQVALRTSMHDGAEFGCWCSRCGCAFLACEKEVVRSAGDTSANRGTDNDRPRIIRRLPSSSPIPNHPRHLPVCQPHRSHNQTAPCCTKSSVEPRSEALT